MDVSFPRRLVDVTAGILGLVLTAPLIGAFSVIARIESGRSGIFRQTRYGIDGLAFTIYKIRSFDSHAEPLPLTGQLRKRGLDELPQLLNIVKGDMSIIGPRPLMHGLHDQPGWRHTLEIPPGLTGMNSIIEKSKGVPNDLATRVAIENDYVDLRLSKRSCLKTDIKILFATAKIIVKGQCENGKYPFPGTPSAVSRRTSARPPDQQL